ncbi:hypothetical protein HAD_15527 [Hyphomonas adhaerens MHS-3]|uniref:Uncharacterized protein n=1 Tax=Hyphomonas adhaerens MHS-3 TaxID=1280949 RepID=A0A069E182_9PROT|nr:hypothetical protein [Hyphomonas adhaerens]KCZ83111.1 hypothetical protein HAD_15527 [Hyphomonas adhaerens MHS-3]
MSEWTQEQVMAELDPYFDEIDAICRGGLTRYQQYPADIRIEHDARAAASCIYTHMVTIAEEQLTPAQGVNFKSIRGLKVWIIGEKATIRFKKMDEEGRSRNYPTKQIRAFDRQMPLPGIPHPALNLVVGYLPNALGTEVERVQVARPSGKSVDWCAAILPVEDRAVGQPRWVDVTVQARLG